MKQSTHCLLLVTIQRLTLCHGVARQLWKGCIRAALADFIAEVEQRLGQMVFLGHPLVKCDLHDGFDARIEAMPDPAACLVCRQRTRDRAGQKPPTQTVNMRPVDVLELGSQERLLTRQETVTERAQHAGNLDLTFRDRG